MLYIHTKVYHKEFKNNYIYVHPSGKSRKMKTMEVFLEYVTLCKYLEHTKQY